MVKKFHVNPANGEIAPCHASKRPCLYGGDESHGDSPQEAQRKYELNMSAATERKLSKTPRTRKNGFTPSANPEQAEAMRLLGRSSATEKHDSRPNRQRTRAGAKKAALRDQY